jgi:hypothetical protein
MNYSINIKKTALLKAMRKSLYCSLVLMSCLLIQSCRTEIPKCDTTPPNFSFRITGDGYDHTFTQADDFEGTQLNLRTGVTYNFVYTGYDAGGMADMRLIVPFIHVEAHISGPWTASTSGGFSDLSWYGDFTHPVTGSLVTGTFSVSAVPAPFSIWFSLGDFGGSCGGPNGTVRILYISIGNHNTGIGKRH